MIETEPLKKSGLPALNDKLIDECAKQSAHTTRQSDDLAATASHMEVTVSGLHKYPE